MDARTTILIVDDDPASREILRVLLRDVASTLLFAETGGQAIELATDHTPDLMLLDVILPDIDGYEACRQLRASPRTATMPIVMVTALGDRAARLRAIEVGADDFISKPFDRVELRTRVQTITKLNRYRALLHERTRLDWVIEHAEDGYVSTDTHDRVVFANARARTLLHLDPHQPLSSDLTFSEIVAQHYHLVPHSSEQERAALPYRYLVRPATRESPALWLQADGLIQQGGPHSEQLIRLRDVTSAMARQHVQVSFQQVIAHKLRTPLVGVLGSLEVLTRMLSRLGHNDLDELVQVAMASSRRLKGAVEDVLAYGSADRVADGSVTPIAELAGHVGAVSAELQISSPSVIVEPSLASMALPVGRRGIELILRELLENARKFHPQLTPQVEVRVSAGPEGAIVLQIVDDGRWLSPELLHRAWVPYVQTESQFTGEVPGMGLGMATVAGVVWSIGGTCAMANRRDRHGVVVELTFPALASSPPPEPLPTSQLQEPS